jgi:glycosyltransferase involved in cell wall biosynthesis
MRVVHLAERIVPFWPSSAGARTIAELPLAQQGSEDELIVVSAAPVTAVKDFSSTQQFARRLEPLVVADGSFEAVVLESTLKGTPIRLYLLVLPSDRVGDFSAAALALLSSLPDAPDLLHLHGDTGLDVDAVRAKFEGVAVIQSVYLATGSDAFAAALVDADEVVTPCGDLSEASDANGSAVAKALRDHAGLSVVNHGIDLQHWDPSRDRTLPAGFDTESPEGKAACKKALQVQAGLAPREDVPIIAVWSEGGEASGLAFVAANLEAILALDVQLVVLRPESGGVDEALAALQGDQIWQADEAKGSVLRQVLAGCDVVLLPDRTATLGQRAMIATRYGLVPVARRVNAHRDRLVEFDGLSNTGGAFLFDEPEDEELIVALRRMRRTFGAPESWPGMLRANGAVDVSWSRTAAQLQSIYEKALTK